MTEGGKNMFEQIKKNEELLRQRAKLEEQRLEKTRSHADIAIFLAVKNLFFKKKMLFLIIIIIGLGFLSTVFTTSIINGLQYEIEEKAISVMTGNLIVEPKADEEYIYNAFELEKKAYSIPGVVGVSPHIDSAVTLTDSKGKRISAQMRIIDPDKEATTTAVSSNMMAGEYLSKTTTDEILIGSDLTEKYRMQKALPAIDIDAGDTVTATFANGVTKPVKIRGVYGLKFAITDIYVYVTQEEAKQIFASTDESFNTASNVLIKTDKRGGENEVAYKLEEYGINGQIWTWEEKLGVLDQFIDSLLVVNQIIGVIGIIIAFATVYIMIYINVMQKRSQIGIMKAMGIDKRTILTSYIIQSTIYGILGCVFGIMLTTGAIQYFTIYKIATPMGTITPSIHPINYATSFAIILVSSIVAGYFAAQGVVKDNILDAIFRG